MADSDTCVDTVFSTRPTAAADLRGAFEVISTWDTRGLIVEATYRISRGEPTRVDNGCSTAVLVNDQVGNIAEFRCLNEERAPTISTDGWSIVRVVSDERGNPVTRRFFDRADKPGIQGESYVTVRRDTPPPERRRGWRFSMRPTSLARFGKDTRAIRAPTSRGNLVRVAYFDEAGHPTLIVGGYADYALEYDKEESRDTNLVSGHGWAPRAPRCNGDAVVQTRVRRAEGSFRG